MIDWIQLLASFTGSLGFAYLFKLKGKNAWWAGLAGGFAWFVYLFLEALGVKYGMCMMFAGIALGAYAEVMAIKTKMPKTAYISVGIIPLIPGAALYYTLFNFIQGNYGVCSQYALTAVITAVTIAGGLLISMSFGEGYRRMKKGDIHWKEKMWR